MSIEHLSFQDTYRIRLLTQRKISRAQRRHQAAVARQFRRMAVAL